MERKLIRLSKSVIGDEEKRAVVDVLDREYLGMGKDVQDFENALTEFIGRPTVCVNTGTAALHLALQAVGLQQGDEVLVQSLTYLASYQPITATGATPVPCEVKEDTFMIDLEDAAAKITEKTKAIMPVFYAGCPGDIGAIYAFAEKHGLRVIEDAAHAFGTVYKGKTIGSFGDISCFSFDGIKNITSGEGGAIVTDDEEILQKVRDARLLGVQKDTEKRYAGQRSWEFEVEAQGWRYHMSNIMAAIGIEQLKKFPHFKTLRQNYAKRYQSFFTNYPEVKILNHNYDEVVPHIFVIRVATEIRDQLKQYLSEHNIQNGLHYKPNHLLDYFRKQYSSKLPVTEKIYSEIITLPLHPDIIEEDMTFICDTLESFLKEKK